MLGTDLQPKNPDDELDKAIDELERQLSERIEGFAESAAAMKAGRAAEEGMLRQSGLRLRWYDGTLAPRRELRTGRLKYLRTLLAELGPFEEATDSVG